MKQILKFLRFQETGVVQSMHEDYTHGGCVRRSSGNDESGRPCMTAGGFDLAAAPRAVVCQAKRISERRKAPVLLWEDHKNRPNKGKEGQP